MALGGFLSAASGIAGLIGAGQQAQQQSAYERAAANALKARTKGMNAALGIAENYDPKAEDQAAIDYASNVAGTNLTNNLAELNQRFRNAGGTPGGDSLFRVSSTSAANRALDPLKAFAAQQASTQTSRKLDALGAAMGTGGDLADNYQNLASSIQPNYGAAIQTFANGFNQLTAKKPKAALGTLPVVGL